MTAAGVNLAFFLQNDNEVLSTKMQRSKHVNGTECHKENSGETQYIIQKTK